MERVDRIAGMLLRPAAELADHVYRLGYRGTSCDGARGWLHLSPFWKKKVSEVSLVEAQLTLPA